MRKFSWGVFYATPLVLFILFAVPAVYADTYIGDSIALGAGHAAHQTTYARVGVGSCWMDRRAPSSLPNFILAHPIIVSAGVNDEGRCVAHLRARAGHAQVIWIVPPPKYERARAAILAAGRAWGDRFVIYTPGRDGLHPRNYMDLVRSIEATEGQPR
jgi:hypothetical protein